jgi:Uma2 family endonuclease
MTITATKKFTIEEYLELEAKSLSKHDYYNGKIFEMAGGTTTHNQLTMTVGTEILLAIRQQNEVFHLYSSDMKIWIEQNKSFVYPDAVTVAHKPEFYNNRRDIITNPLFAVDVISLGSEYHDRGYKFNDYRIFASFEEYLIIYQDRYQVSRFFRQAPDVWHITDYFQLEDRIPLQSMGVEISMQGIYRGVELEA